MSICWVIKRNRVLRLKYQQVFARTRHFYASPVEKWIVLLRGFWYIVVKSKNTTRKSKLVLCRDYEKSRWVICTITVSHFTIMHSFYSTVETLNTLHDTLGLIGKICISTAWKKLCLTILILKVWIEKTVFVASGPNKVSRTHSKSGFQGQEKRRRKRGQFAFF